MTRSPPQPVQRFTWERTDRTDDLHPGVPRLRGPMTSTSIDAPHDVRDLALADAGRRRTEWAERFMPVLRQIRERFAQERPLAGRRDLVLPARHHRNRQPDDDVAGRRCRGGALCLEPVVDPGRRRGAPRARSRRACVCHQGRESRDVLHPHRPGACLRSRPDPGRRRRPGRLAPPDQAGTPRRPRRADPRDGGEAVARRARAAARRRCRARPRRPPPA